MELVLVLPPAGCWDEGEGDGVRRPWGCQSVCRGDQRHLTGGNGSTLPLGWRTSRNQGHHRLWWKLAAPKLFWLAPEILLGKHH